MFQVLRKLRLLGSVEERFSKNVVPSATIGRKGDPIRGIITFIPCLGVG